LVFFATKRGDRTLLGKISMFSLNTLAYETIAKLCLVYHIHRWNETNVKPKPMKKEGDGSMKWRMHNGLSFASCLGKCFECVIRVCCKRPNFQQHRSHAKQLLKGPRTYHAVKKVCLKVCKGAKESWKRYTIRTWTVKSRGYWIRTIQLLPKRHALTKIGTFSRT